jgi:hypothetical protein
VQKWTPRQTAPRPANQRSEPLLRAQAMVGVELETSALTIGRQRSDLRQCCSYVNGGPFLSVV